MGLKVVPHDGKFSALSTFSDVVLLIDATREELIEWYVDREARRAREHIEFDLKLFDGGTSRFSSATLLEILETHHPDQVVGDDADDWNVLIAKRLEEERAKAKDTA